MEFVGAVVLAGVGEELVILIVIGGIGDFNRICWLLALMLTCVPPNSICYSRTDGLLKIDVLAVGPENISVSDVNLQNVQQ